MTNYIILRDSFTGSGLEEIKGIGLNVFEDSELNDYIEGASELILEEDGWDGIEAYNEENIPMGETLVICQILAELDGKRADSYINDLLQEREEEKDKEEYELYLKLKSKYEGGQ